MKNGTILFADDEDHLRIAANQVFDLAEMNARIFDGGRSLLAEVSHDLDGVVVTDIRMPDFDGLELLRGVLEIDPEFPVILVTGHGDVELAVGCMREGAYDFIEKPYEPSRLVETVKRALDKRRLTLDNRNLRQKLASGPGVSMQLSGHSPLIDDVRRRIEALAGAETDVLITGATGTGKGVAAQILHAASERADRPFVHINCAALPVDLVEIELFGHEAGAFPSAMRSRFGKLEHARGGIVFLDEVETLPLNVQAKLLHVIEDREITRLGSNDPIELDVRFIAAAKTDLKIEAQEGRFRSDLYFRLAGAEVTLPSLDERREDVPKLFVELVERSAVRHKRKAPQIPPAVLGLLASRSWPGNIRELNNVAERFVLGLDMQLATIYQTAHSGQSLSEKLADHERALIAASLASHNGSLKGTYEALGVSRKALYEKMQKYGLDREKFVED